MIACELDRLPISRTCTASSDTVLYNKFVGKEGYRDVCVYVYINYYICFVCGLHEDAEVYDAIY